ncbi:MAG: flagellar biosynthesis anti-sigma factor FlgM [Bryobacteraceae bacterium]
MKINDTNVGGLGSQGIGKALETEQGERTRQSRTGDRSSSSADKVQLSNLSETLRASDSESPERAAHLARVASAVQGGHYHVDSTVLSKSIVQDAIKEK